MVIDFKTFEDNVTLVKERIAKACRKTGRNPESVTLLPVTKRHPAVYVEYVVRTGMRQVGENRVQEAVEKKSKLSCAVRWELIGHLQGNKAKLAVATFDRIQSVDSEKLLQSLNRYSGEAGRQLSVLLQVNAGEDPRKSGVSCADAARLLEFGLSCGNLSVEGLMTIAPYGGDLDEAARTFERLRELRDELSSLYSVRLPELSMGMTGDLEKAVEAGSTCIRVGTALFGPRANGGLQGTDGA